MRVDLQDVDRLSGRVQRIEHRDGDAMVAAQDQDLRALPPQMPESLSDGGRVVVVRRAPRNVAEIEALLRQGRRGVGAGVEVPVAGRIAEPLGVRADGVRRARLIVRLWVLRIRLAARNPEDRHLRVPL